MWRYGDTNDDYHNLDYTFNIRELYFPEDFQEIRNGFNICETLEKKSRFQNHRLKYNMVVSDIA